MKLLQYQINLDLHIKIPYNYKIINNYIEGQVNNNLEVITK